jgi:hypothetical protein
MRCLTSQLCIQSDVFTALQLSPLARSWTTKQLHVATQAAVLYSIHAVETTRTSYLHDALPDYLLCLVSSAHRTMERLASQLGMHSVRQPCHVRLSPLARGGEASSSSIRSSALLRPRCRDHLSTCSTECCHTTYSLQQAILQKHKAPNLSTTHPVQYHRAAPFNEQLHSSSSSIHRAAPCRH